jgi:pimeloyl-ACP methyl ester carboxylesterase
MSSTSASITSGHGDVAGVNLFYLEAGPTGAPTVVLLHGYPSSSRMYAPLIPMLADRYHLIAPDYPGFGQSEAPTPSRYRYTFDHLAETMSALLDRLNVDRYALFMQDYGGLGLPRAGRHWRTHAMFQTPRSTSWTPFRARRTGGQGRAVNPELSRAPHGAA